MFYCLRYPETLCKLEAEISETFASVDDVHVGAKLSSCQYLRSCIDEALRLSPPVGGLLPREVLPGGIDIDGHHFPKGVDVGTPHYALHHHEKYYADAFTFRPSWWIVDSETGVTESDVRRSQSAFCPFSIGPRSCPRKGLAYIELMIVLARMILLFEFRLLKRSSLGERMIENEKQCVPEFETLDGFVATNDGPMVEFRLKTLKEKTDYS